MTHGPARPAAPALGALPFFAHAAVDTLPPPHRRAGWIPPARGQDWLRLRVFNKAAHLG